MVQVSLPSDSGRHSVVEPCSLVIFGASGDLTRRKLMPAIYNLLSTACFHLALPSSGQVERPAA